MKYTLIALAASLTAGSLFAADVGVSISVGQPGFYGRIDQLGRRRAIRRRLRAVAQLHRVDPAVGRAHARSAATGQVAGNAHDGPRIAIDRSGQVICHGPGVAAIA